MPTESPDLVSQFEEEQAPADSSTAVPPYAKPGPYNTQLAPDQEKQFQGWVKTKNVPWQDSPTADYDMRGYWKAQQSGDANAKQQQSDFDGKMHFPDTYKTPYHKTFSNESMYATPDAPRWDGDRLVDKSGKVLADETPKQTSTPDLVSAYESEQQQSQPDLVSQFEAESQRPDFTAEALGGKLASPAGSTRALPPEQPAPAVAMPRGRGDVSQAKGGFFPPTDVPIQGVKDIKEGVDDFSGLPVPITQVPAARGQMPRPVTYKPQLSPEEQTVATQQENQRAAAATKIIQGAGEVGSIALPGAAMVAPIPTVASIVAGTAASKGTGALVHGHMSPEAEDLARSAAFFLPSVLGTAAGVKYSGIESPGGEAKFSGVEAFGGRAKAAYVRTPESFRVGAKVGDTQVEARFSRSQPAPPPEPSEAAKMLGEFQQASGATPTPPPPAPPPQYQGPDHLTPEVAKAVTTNIMKAPPADRPKLMLEAHQNMVRWMINKGTFTGPDSKIYSVDNEGQAKKLASTFINDQVDATDKAAEAAAKAAQQPATTPAKAPISKPKATTQRPVTTQPAAQPLPTTAPVSGKAGGAHPMGKGMTQDSPVVEKVAKEAKLTPGQEPLVMVKEEKPADVEKLAQPPEPVKPEELAAIGTKDKESGRTILQPSDDVLQNERMAAEAAPELATKLSEISGNVDGARFDRMRPQKNLERITEKEDADKPPSTIADYSAAQIAADTPEAKDQLIAELHKNFKVLSVEDKFTTGDKDLQNYPSVKVQVQLSNGHTSEVQIVPTEMQEVADHAHHFYSEGRKADAAGDNAKRDEMWAQSEKINTDALDRAKDSWKAKGWNPDGIASSGENAPDLVSQFEGESQPVKQKPSPEEYIWAKIKEKDIPIHSSFTGEGLKSHLDLPQDLSLRDMEHAGLIVRNNEGLWEFAPHITGEADRTALAAGNPTHPASLDKGERQPEHKFASTQINIDPKSDLGKAHAKAVAAIPQEHIGKEGIEKTPHVTVRYGLKDDSPESIQRIRDAAAKIAPFEVPVGKTDIFPATEHSSFDHPAIARLETTPELKALRSAVESAGGFAEDNFPEYKPHVTLGYIKPEFAQQYKGGGHLEGHKVPVREITVSKRDGTKETIPLGGKAQEAATPARRSIRERSERRANEAERKRVADMSPEERAKELLTSDAVDLPNKRAFMEKEQDKQAPAVAISDADGLKALNDKFGYDSGTALLRAKAEALKEAGLDAYHDKGDEFVHRGASDKDLSVKLEKAREILRNSIIEVETKDGGVLQFKGADFSYGTGKNLTDAESGLKAHKSEREARGERARGELRGIVEVRPEGRKEDNGSSQSPADTPEVASPKSSPARKRVAARQEAKRLVAIHPENLTEARKEVPDVSKPANSVAKPFVSRRSAGSSESGAAPLDLAADAAGGAVKVAKSFFDKDLKPITQGVVGGLKEVVKLGLNVIAPRMTAPPQSLDVAMKMKGQREEELFRFDRTMDALHTMFDKMGTEGNVRFIDDMMRGRNQASPELDEVAQALRQVQERFRAMERPFLAVNQETGERGTDKENYFHLKWKVLPSGVDEEGNIIEGTGGEKTYTGSSTRPLQGGRSFMKRKTLPDASTGIARGGELISTNPIDLVRHRVEESLKFTTARKAWEEHKSTPYTVDDSGRILHISQFFKKGSDRDARALGYDELNDSIAKVMFPAGSGEGMIDAGKYWVEANTARLYNNFLSKDWIREKVAGRGFIALKNGITAWRLAFSPFHAITESILAVGSEIGRGIEHAFNEGVRHGSPTEFARGMGIAVKGVAAPVTAAREGGKAVRYVTDPDAFLQTSGGKDWLKKYPEANELITDLFTGGAKLAMHEDFRINALQGLRQEIADNNYIGAAFRAPMALNQTLQHPLFEVYIPRLKVGMFLREYSQALADRADEMEAGKVNRAKLSRDTWDGIDHRFGELAWDNFFWNRTFKTANQILWRAFSWTYGNFKFVQKAATGQAQEIFEAGKYWKDAYDHTAGTDEQKAKPGTTAIPRLDRNMAKILGMLTVGIAVHTALQLYFTHELPKDHKDLIAPRDGTKDKNGQDNRWSAPLVPFKDIESAANNPGHYVKGKFADIWTAVPETINNRDFNNHLISHPSDPAWEQMYDRALHVVGSPIGYSKYRQEKKQGSDTETALLGTVGITRVSKNTTATPAEKKMREIRASHFGPMTDEELEAREQKDARIAAGNLTRHERQKQRNDARKNMFEKDMEQFSYDQVKQVYDLANPDEQAMMRRILLQKRFARTR